MPKSNTPILESNKIRASLLCVGSELLRGKINTHASTIARRLASVGLDLREEHTVADDEEAIAKGIRSALEENRVVMVTGGLGPTFDDLTREAASLATGRPLVFSADLFKNIQAKFRLARYRKMPLENKRQAYLLEGAKPISNRVGTAPGQWLDLGNQLMILLPGPPSELEPMLESFVLSQLRRTFPPVPRAEAHLHFMGLPESIVDHKVRPIIARARDADFTILAHLGLVDLDIFVSGTSQKEAAGRLKKMVRAVQKKVGKSFYGMNDDYPLEKVVMKRFVSQKATLSVAESCTGGMLASRLTDIPGCSDYFVEGRVTYANAAKMNELGVPEPLLKRDGAVSRPVALAMAKGIRSRARTTHGLSITGIAGPGGGTPQKPVGLVYIALATPRGAFCREHRFRGDRGVIRQRSVLAALDLLRLIYL